MHFFFPIIVASLFVGLAGWSEQIYSALYEKKKCQIAVDNVIIKLARSDRALFAALDRVQSRLRLLHHTHHPLHLCARNPLTALKCAAADRFWEMQIHTQHRMATVRAQSAWVLHPLTASAHWIQLEIPAGRFLRAPHLPASTRLCPVCRLPAGWNWHLEAATTQVKGCESTFGSALAEIKWREQGRRFFQYRLSR